MLDRLQWDRDTCKCPELFCPHTGTIDHVLGLNVSLIRDDSCHATLHPRDAGHGYPLEHFRSQQTRSLCQRHGHIHRIGTTLVGGVKPGNDLTGIKLGPDVRDFLRRDFFALDPHQLHEVGLPTELVRPFRSARSLEVPDRSEPGG